MGLGIYEQETCVHYMRDGEHATVYTTDSTMMTKLDKLAVSPDAPHWELVKEHRLQGGEVIGKTYKTLKRLISFRADVVTREMTEEQKEAAAERMRRWREEQKDNNRKGGTGYEET